MTLHFFYTQNFIAASREHASIAKINNVDTYSCLKANKLHKLRTRDPNRSIALIGRFTVSNTHFILNELTT